MKIKHAHDNSAFRKQLKLITVEIIYGSTQSHLTAITQFHISLTAIR